MVSESEQIMEQRMVSSMLAAKGHTALGCGGEYFSSFSRILQRATVKTAKTSPCSCKRKVRAAGESARVSKRCR